MFFAPITALVMKNAGKKIEQAITTMTYVRFVGASFGTAIATNNIVFYKNQEFDSMTILQNRDLLQEFLNKLHFYFGVAGNEVFRMVEQFFSFDYGFKYVWMNAGFWGVVGSVFVFGLIFIRRRNGENG